MVLYGKIHKDIKGHIDRLNSLESMEVDLKQ